MNQTIALQARGTRLDPLAIQSELERLRAAKMRNDEAQAEISALANYRRAAQAGDPNAISQLNGYPEHQKKIMDAFNGATPEQAMEMKVRSRAIGDAARYVMSFPEGSPQRAQAWNASIDDLAKKGYIQPDQAKMYKEAGPNTDILNEAIDVDKLVEGYTSGKARTERLRGNRIENQIGLDTAESEAKVGKTKAETESITKRGAATSALTEEKANTEVSKQGKYGADTELSGARKANVEGKTQNESALTEARKGKITADTELSRAKTATEGERAGEVKSRTGLNEARTGQVKSKTETDKAESDATIANKNADTDLKRAQIGESQAKVKNLEDMIAKRVSKGGGAGITPRDRVAIEKALLERKKDLGIDAPLPEDASDDEKKAFAAATRQYEDDTAGLRAMLPENQPSKQGPAGNNADIIAAAKDAIKRGADPAAVKKRLKEKWNIDADLGAQ